ncbi:competence type IV pilus major pilin ComGC [Leuconostoc miyukkimchii]|uniref:competence type IV pilus major pilin ComGC n=1 Tax=Leuconostoc miyukkimchii TaxID=910540 RepID=UPI001C7DAB6E|nr:competence type IV pilus major pilin ComGC [Leuconostoc miyukkimchii]
MKNINKKRQAFTLIEAAIVLFIISLLMLLILPNLNAQRQRAVETHATAMVSTVQTQIDLYVNEHPEAQSVTINDLVTGDYLTPKQAQKIKDLNITVANNEAHK